MNELITSYKDLSHADLLLQAGRITAALATAPASTWFAQAAAERDEVQAQEDRFSAALSQETSASVTLHRHAIRKALRNAIAMLGKRVEIIASGDREKLSRTGFAMRRIPVRGHAPPAMPLRVRVKAGPRSGSVTGSCSPVAHAHSYEVETCPAPAAGQWVRAGFFTNSRNLPAAGFERGTSVFLRVRAIGANGQSQWSSPASVMVL